MLLVFVTMKHRDIEVTLRVLLDSGAGASLITSKYCPKVTTNNNQVNCITITGKFSTQGTVSKRFKLPKLSLSVTINYTLHVTQSLGLYEMIIGRDFLKSLRLIMDFSSRTIEWNEVSIPMKNYASAPAESFHI